MPRELDEIDKKVLRYLQNDAGLSNKVLADLVGLSPSPCLRRVKGLEREGVIQGYYARLDKAAVDLTLVIFTRVTLDRQDKSGVESFAERISRVPEVLECYPMAGSYDYLLKVAARDLDDYQRFQMQHLTPMPGVRNVVTEIPLRIVQSTSVLPVY